MKSEANGTATSPSTASTKTLTQHPAAPLGSVQSSKIIKADSSEPLEVKVKRLESDNASLRTKLKAAEADLSQKEVDASCKLTTYFFAAGNS